MFNDSSPHGTKGGIVNLRQILLGIAISAGLTLATVSHAQSWHSKHFRTPAPAPADTTAPTTTTTAPTTTTTAPTTDTTAPTTPSGLAASAVTSTSLTLSWNASTDNVGVTGYQVYRGGTQVASPSGTSASITGLSAAVPYSFTVSAVDAAGNVSALSAALSVTTPPPGSANLSFSSGFEGTTALLAPSGFYGNGAWQDIVGTDSVTGFAWPPIIKSSSTTHFQLGVDAPVDALTINNYMVNQIQTVTGHNGNQTRTLYSEIKQSGCCGTNPQGSGPTQNSFQIQPASEPGDLYISYWLKLQPDLANLMAVGQVGTGWNWRDVFSWKTAGDYRVKLEIKRDPYINGGNLFWATQGDNNANGGLPYQIFWQSNNTQVPVPPVGQWMKMEVFWHRSSGNDGRVWMAVNGQVIVDHYGPNMGIYNAAINRIYAALLYSSTAYPIYQWVDDMQIWDSFPPDAAPH